MIQECEQPVWQGDFAGSSSFQWYTQQYGRLKSSIVYSALWCCGTRAPWPYADNADEPSCCSGDFCGGLLDSFRSCDMRKLYLKRMLLRRSRTSWLRGSKQKCIRLKNTSHTAHNSRTVGWVTQSAQVQLAMAAWLGVPLSTACLGVCAPQHHSFSIRCSTNQLI